MDKDKEELIRRFYDKVNPPSLKITGKTPIDIVGLFGRGNNEQPPIPLKDYFGESLGKNQEQSSGLEDGTDRVLKTNPIALDPLPSIPTIKEEDLPSSVNLSDSFNGLSDILKNNTDAKEKADASAELDIDRANLADAETQLSALSDLLLSDKFANDQIRASGKAVPGRISATAKGEDDPLAETKALLSADILQQAEDRKGTESDATINSLLRGDDRKDKKLNLDKLLGLSKNRRENKLSRANIANILSSKNQNKRRVDIQAYDAKIRAINSAYRNALDKIRVLSQSKNLDEKTLGEKMMRQVQILKKKKENKSITAEEFANTFDMITRQDR